MNEQEYLNTICKSRRPAPKPRKCDKHNDECCFECSYKTPCGRLTLRRDNHSTGICIDICNPKPPCK